MNLAAQVSEVPSGSAGNQTPAASPPALLGANGLARPEPGGWRFGWGILAIAAAALTVGFLMVGRTRPEQINPPPRIASLQFDGSTLGAIDPRGRLNWRKTFQQPLIQEFIYRDSTSFHDRNDSGEPPYLMADLDGDMQKEILVMTGQDTVEFVSHTLHCLAPDGQERWQYQPAESLTFGHQAIGADWRIEYFFAEDLDGDGLVEIVLNSRHVSLFPAKITVLESNGKILSCFYNHGWIYYFGAYDLDRDGQKEILCAGTNNTYQKGSFAVLDNDAGYAGSPQREEPAGRCPSWPPEAPKYYLLFPRDCLNLHFSVADRGELHLLQVRDNQIWLRQQTWLPKLGVCPEVIFMLNFSLQPLQTIAADGYERTHQELMAKGLLKHTFSQAELAFPDPAEPPVENRRSSRASGLEPILYWDGEKFVSAPTMNRRKLRAH